MTKTLIITGGSRGIGAAVARLAGGLGCSVVVNYLGNEAAALDTCSSVVAAGGQALAVQGDMAQEPDVLRLFDTAEARFGRIDGLVVNAGIVARSLPLADMSLERIETVMRLNVIGALLTAREGARRMGRGMGEDSASIVLVSSAAARLGSPNEYVDYAASKGAIDTLAIGLAKELAPQNIRVNAVRPGLIETDIHASGGDPDRANRLGVQVPAGRAGKAEEVAEGILWLLEGASSYVTGTHLDISGGR
ncbi:SDR family oxidoreductase [Nioella aestuarii]|uniref:SDR family oxidoreductase n=1 Tax=Nioella aestuarii TaxID=1662864 RepID=UPI003D8001A4